MTATLPHYRKLCVFLALSAADLALTWHLLCGTADTVHEANPVANWMLESWGWGGLAVFKAVMALVVVGLAFGVERRRTAAGGFVLLVGCTILTAVVAYSTALSIAFATRSEGLLDAELAHVLRQQDTIDDRIDAEQSYRVELARLARELAEERCELAEAVSHLSSTQRGCDPAWREHLQVIFPRSTAQQSMAAHLIHHALVDARARNPHRSEAVTRRLTASYLAWFPSQGESPSPAALFTPRPPLSVPVAPGASSVAVPRMVSGEW